MSRIARIDVLVFQRALPGGDDVFLIKQQSLRPLLAEAMCIRIVDTDGCEGFSFGLKGGPGTARYVASYVRPALVGHDPADREGLMQQLYRLDRLWVLPQLALGPVDVALWDLYGKQVGAPIYQLLGGVRSQIPSYASSMTKASVPEYVEEALKYREQGFHAYKIHVPGTPRADVEVCAAVRDAVGPDYPLMVDVVAAYRTYDEALWVGRQLEQLDYHWYEEPLPDNYITAYQRLSADLDIAVAGAEVIGGGLQLAAEFVATRAVDIIRADVTYKAGISTTRKIAALAEAHGMNCEIHTNANPVLDAANLHVACSIPNTEYYEQLVPADQFASGVISGIVIDGDGMAHCPDGPGLGIDVDWAYIDGHTLETL